MALATVGTISYNGYVFSEKTQTVSVDGRPVYDTAGRTIIYTIYTFNIKTIVTSGNPTYDTGASLVDIRRKLLSPGGAFSYISKGFGDLTINALTVKDVIWGPRPTLLKWRPIGSSSACEVEWSVEIAIPECSTAQYTFAPMEFNYRIQFSIDEGGYTRRTYSGFIRIPQTRATQGTRTLTDTADRLRERIAAAPLLGFRRVSQDFVLDEAKTRLDFTVLDEELPANPPPRGVILVESSHEVQNQQPGFVRWVGTVTASYELAPGVPRGAAWDAFFTLLKDRVLSARLGSVSNKPPSKNNVIPLSLRLSEPEIYGRKGAAFSFSYSFANDLRTILNASGLWRPVPGANASLWAASLGETAFHPRGNARLGVQPNDDAIVDLCQQEVRKLTTAPPPQRLLRTRLFTPFFLQCPPPEKSFLMYQNRLEVQPFDGIAIHTPLPDSKIVIKRSSLKTDLAKKNFDQLVGNVPQGDQKPGAEAAKIQANIDSYQIPYASGRTSRIQNITKPQVFITLNGFALRACYRIQPPVLLNVGGFIAMPANGPSNFFQTWLHANYGLPVVAARWSLRYVLTGIPAAGLDIPPNPLGG